VVAIVLNEKMLINMLYLIGGPPRCGKTTLSKALAIKLEIPYFSIDHIASVIPPYIPAERQAECFPLKALRQHFNTNNQFFERYSSQEIVDAYRKQAMTCWPGIKNFIQYAVEDEHDLILEGWQLLPHLLEDIPSTTRPDKVQVNYLYKTDVEEICSGLKANQGGNDWVLRHTKEETTFTRIATMISRFGMQTREEAAKAGFEAINMDLCFSENIAATRDVLAERYVK
jgi:2-phosphoglycerate kinase